MTLSQTQHAEEFLKIIQGLPEDAVLPAASRVRANFHPSRSRLRSRSSLVRAISEHYNQTTFQISEALVHVYWRTAQNILKSSDNGLWFRKVLHRFSKDWERLFPEIKGICRWNPGREAAPPSDPHGRELIRHLGWHHHVAIVTLILIEMAACIPVVRFLLLRGAQSNSAVLDYVADQIDLDGIKRGIRRLGLS